MNQVYERKRGLLSRPVLSFLHVMCPVPIVIKRNLYRTTDLFRCLTCRWVGDPAVAVLGAV